MTSKAESNPLAISSDVSRISLPDMVAAHAARLPEAIAASAGSRFLTYKELDGQANRLARYLRSRGAAADVPVGLCLPRSLEMVVAALGIMKAGAAFVPMDPSYPVDRLSYMLSDAQAPLVVADASTAQRLPQASHEIVDIASPELSTGPDHLPCIEILPSDLAYIIYTSGST